MLSTPTASTKKGITSIMIRVALIPNHEQKPNDDATDNKTMTTPTIPTVIFASTYNQKIYFIFVSSNFLMQITFSRK